MEKPEAERPRSEVDMENDPLSATSKEDIESPTRSSSPEPELDEHDRAGQDATLTKTTSVIERVSLPREALVVGLICLAQLTTQLGLGQVLAILHIIGDHFGVTDPGILAWLIAGYSLTVGSFILFSGRLGDLFGWKFMLVIGYVWFGIWSIVAGLSWYSNHVLFVFARVLSGIGPAICMPNGLALLGGLYGPSQRKNMAFALFGACAPGGALIGYAFAGIFAQLAWWPWTFWSFGIALFCIAVAVQVAIPDPQDEKPGLEGKDFMGAIWELDLLGAAVGITALILFNFAWNQAPLKGVGWSSPYIIVCLILGVIMAPLFFWIETRVARNPLLPLDVFTSSNGFVLACVACGWGSFGIWVFYIWQILQELRGASPLLISAYLSPLALSGIVAAVSTGALLHKVRPATIMIIALCAFMTSSILTATLPPHQIYWAQIFVTTLIAPFGMDMSFPSATLVISDSVAKRHQGVAASLVNTVVNYSISMGLGFAGTVEVNVNRGGTTPHDQLLGYRGALYMGIGLAGFGVCLAIIFLAKSHLDDHRDQKNSEKQSAAAVEA